MKKIFYAAITAVIILVLIVGAYFNYSSSDSAENTDASIENPVHDNLSTDNLSSDNPSTDNLSSDNSSDNPSTDNLSSDNLSTDNLSSDNSSDNAASHDLNSNNTNSNESAYTFRNETLLNQHYEKHGIDMGFASAKEYEAAANKVILNPNSLHKKEAEDNDDVYYLEETNEFVIVSVDGYIRTYFNPDRGIDYYNRQ